MSILQELLNLGLVDIGSDDSRFEKMQSAASTLAKRFTEEPTLLIPAALVALDDDVDDDDPIFAQVEELVITEWNTLRNTHVTRPRHLLRSVVIEALASTTEGNAEISGVVWNTAASRLRHGQARLGKAAPVVERLLEQACEIAETEAVGRAGMADLPFKKRRRRKRSKSDDVTLELDGTIEEAESLKEVARAAGSQYPPGQGLTDPNPHPTTQAPEWSQEFTPRMTAAVVKAVNRGTSRLSESLSESLDGYLGAREKRLLEQLRGTEQIQMAQSYASSRMRLDVLWWSEALYSPSLQGGYRELPLPVAVVAAAIDLAAIVPALSPASVSYVLGETMLRLCRILDVDEKQQLGSYLLGLSEAKPDFGEALPRSTTDDTRLPLIDLVGEASTGSKLSSDALRKRTGIDMTLELTAAEFSMWVFRDLQARRLVEDLG